MTEERVFEKVISNCKECEHCETKTFTMPDETPDETLEKSPYRQAGGYWKNHFYAYCEKECKFIIPTREYVSWCVSNPIKFPDFCPFKIAVKDK